MKIGTKTFNKAQHRAINKYGQKRLAPFINCPCAWRYV